MRQINNIQPVHDAALKQSAVLSWPRDYSHTPDLSIGKVVELLQEEFPTVSLSKVRFLEDQGLVEPARTGAGYRKYSRSDVERLRYVLREQRDTYKQIKVIRDELAELDAGRKLVPIRRMQTVARDGQPVRPSVGAWVTFEQLELITGAPAEFIEEAVQLGIIRREKSGSFPGRMVTILHYLLEIQPLGMPIRNCSLIGRASHRTAEVVKQARVSYKVKTAPVEIEREAMVLTELAQKISALYNEILKDSIEQ